MHLVVEAELALGHATEEGPHLERAHHLRPHHRPVAVHLAQTLKHLRLHESREENVPKQVLAIDPNQAGHSDFPQVVDLVR